MADRYFVCAANGIWNTTANWSTESGGSGGASIPGSDDRAIFDDNSGSCYIRSDVNVDIIDMKSNYGASIIYESGVLSVNTIYLLGGELDLQDHDLTFTEIYFEVV